MTNKQLLLAILLPSIATQAAAKPAGDFGAIAICAKLSAMPKAYTAVPGDCNKRAPLRNCRFTVKGDQWPITYLVEGGKILDKSMTLKPTTKGAGPYGLLRGASETEATAKFTKATGFTLTRWDDADQPGNSYWQTEEMDCPGNSYTISLWFKNAKLDALSVSSLPTV